MRRLLVGACMYEGGGARAWRCARCDDEIKSPCSLSGAGANVLRGSTLLAADAASLAHVTVRAVAACRELREAVLSCGSPFGALLPGGGVVRLRRRGLQPMPLALCDGDGGTRPVHGM